MWNVVFSTGVVYAIYICFGGIVFTILDVIDELGIGVIDKSIDTFNFTNMKLILLENYTEEDLHLVLKEWDKNLVDQYFERTDEQPLLVSSWTYTNSFFFAFHIVSTIGYGDISPTSSLGEMMAVLYATIGIPLHLITFKLLGDAFARSYEGTVRFLKSFSQDDESSQRHKVLADLGFFIPWTLVFFVLPSVIFMYVENWNFIEGVYYCFITLSTIGLGDYVAGNVVVDQGYFVLYKTILIVWMFYGLAFMTMIVDVFTHLYQKHLLFVFKCSWKKGTLAVHRIYIDVEKLDIHFRLLRTEAADRRFTMWGIRRDTVTAVDFQTAHLAHLAILAEQMQHEILKHFDSKETKRDTENKEDLENNSAGCNAENKADLKNDSTGFATEEKDDLKSDSVRRNAENKEDLENDSTGPTTEKKDNLKSDSIP